MNFLQITSKSTNTKSLMDTKLEPSNSPPPFFAR